MSVLVETEPNIYHQEQLYIKDIVILTFDDIPGKEVEIYIQYNIEIGKIQISCYTKGDEDHTVFTYTP